ncbi:hypothetical protein OROGR_012566 [Orobanche gracilis]
MIEALESFAMCSEIHFLAYSLLFVPTLVQVLSSMRQLNCLFGMTFYDPNFSYSNSGVNRGQVSPRASNINFAEIQLR